MRNTSIILEHSNYSQPLRVFDDWLKSIETSNISNLLNNPSLRFMNPEGDSIKIDDIRNFIQELAFPSYDNKKRYFIFFNFDTSTLQAQNAALKAIEEPPENTQIVILTSTLDKLISTVTSRCEVISTQNSDHSHQLMNNQETAETYKKILGSKHYDLINIASTYKERSDAILLLNKLLSYLNSQLHSDNSVHSKKQLSQHLKVILKSIEQLNQNANVKLVLENCFFRLI
jgi:hypothetical protein